MSATIHAECAECGKSYRVPSAERTYDCKACGGEVVPEGYEEEELEEEEDEEPFEPPHRRLSETHREPKEHTGLHILGIAAVLLLIVGGGFYFLYKKYNPTFAAEGVTDLSAVTALFAEDWTAGDLEDLAKYHHPDGRGKFSEVLAGAGARRGWAGGLPAVGKHSAVADAPSADKPQTGVSMLQAGEETITLRWQYSPSAERWFIATYAIRPPELGPRAEAFREAFATSDLEALKPFFRPESASQHLDLFRARAKKLGWLGDHPALGEPKLEGEREAREESPNLAQVARADAVYPVGDDGFTVRWGFFPAEDEWFVVGWGFPK